MSSRNLEIAYIEWGADGKIHRIIKTSIRNEHLNPLDRLAFELKHPPFMEEFDVNWCERDQIYYYYNSGGGACRIFLAGSADPKKHRFKFWAAVGIEFSGWNEKTGKSRKITEAQIKNLGYDRVPDLKWQDDITVGNSMYDRPPGEEGECYWCDACEDMLPKEIPCDHTFYCVNENCAEQHWSQPTHCPDHTVCKHAKQKKVRS